jgi:hypothetical protein
MDRKINNVSLEHPETVIPDINVSRHYISSFFRIQASSDKREAVGGDTVENLKSVAC